jgi:hypothetical protein
VTVSEFTCIALGILFNILTFALGCSVGVSLKRKESPHDGRYRYENEGFEYYPDDPED